MTEHTRQPPRNGAPFCFYREVQRFRQPWLLAVVAGVAGLSIWSFVRQIVQGRPVGQNPAPDVAVAIIGIVFGLGLPALFCAANLTVRVCSDGLHYRFFPFHWSFQRIAPEDVAGFAPHTYSPLRDYGGWGIRWGQGGKAYNVSGNRGVMLELSRGRKLLIGSQKPEQMAEAIALAFGRKPGPTPQP